MCFCTFMVITIIEENCKKVAIYDFVCLFSFKNVIWKFLQIYFLILYLENHSIMKKKINNKNNNYNNIHNN